MSRSIPASRCQSLQFIGVMFLISLVAGCGKTDADPDSNSGDSTNPSALIEVSLQLNWLPEAEHGGYYAALAHGYFEEAGLNVKIVRGGPGVPVIINVATDRMTFGLSNADQILIGRGEEADVVAVFAPLQTSPRCIMVHQKSGIKSFEELKNITVAVNQNSSFGSILKHKVSLDGCKFEPYPGSVAKFLLNDDFAQQGYVFSEPFLATQEGGDPHNLMAADIGFNPYTSVLITHGDTIKKRSDVVQKMVSACKQGWAKYLEDSTETDKRIQQDNKEMDLEALAFGANELKALCLNEQVTPDKIGHMTLERWQAMLDLMVECEVTSKGAVDAQSAFSTKFLK